MTDRENNENKQREILEKLRTKFYHCGYKEGSYGGCKCSEFIDQALAELSELDAIPASKEVEEAVYQAHMKGQRNAGCKEPSYYEARVDCKDLLQAVKPKEEVGESENMEKGYWYCKRCKMPLEPEEVTYEENCAHCGELVSWIEPAPERSS